MAMKRITATVSALALAIGIVLTGTATAQAAGGQSGEVIGSYATQAQCLAAYRDARANLPKNYQLYPCSHEGGRWLLAVYRH
jgi:hypothetical protein